MKMHRIRHVLIFTLCFSLVVLGIHYLYTRNYGLKDTAIHIVQSFQFDLKNGKRKEGEKPLDPHGNDVQEKPKVEDIPPETQQKPVKKDSLPTQGVVSATKINPVKKDEPEKPKTPEKAETLTKEPIKQPTQKLCNERGEKLVGPLAVSRDVPDNDALIKEYSATQNGWVQKGGWWKPKDCAARVKTAVIIPYRKREEQLKIFLKHLHPILSRQQLHYRIFVVEQADNDPFNRAGLFNIGFKEALKYEQFDCFVFSDVDLLPEDDRNYYGCPTSPRHMSVAIDKFNYRLPYEGIFGGVGAFKRKDFETINGFSNIFWGWGGEDDDLYARIRAKGFRLTRPSMSLGRYTMVSVHHFQSHQANPNRMNLLQNSGVRMSTDGLNTLKYNLNKVIELPLVTILNVKLTPAQYEN